MLDAASSALVSGSAESSLIDLRAFLGRAGVLSTPSDVAIVYACVADLMADS